MTKDVPEIVLRTIKEAEARLMAAGVRYAIAHPDGTIHGDLPVKQFGKSLGNRKKRTRRDFLSTGYQERLFAMKVGEVESFSGHGFTGLDWQGTITAAATQKWGKGSYQSCVTTDGSACEIMRIS